MGDPDLARLTRAINDLARVAGHLKEELRKMNHNLSVVGKVLILNKEEESNEPT